MSDSDRKRCPECGSFETEQVEVEWGSNGVRENRACNGCYGGYDVLFELTGMKLTHEPMVER